MVTLNCNLLDTLTSRILNGAPDEVVYLLEDDFNDPKSGWEIYSGEYGSAGYDQGGYLVDSIVESEYNWSVAGVNNADNRIDADVKALQMVEDGMDAFGLDCRLQENGDGYGFRIKSDGYATISKYEDLESTALVDWFETDSIKRDGSVNHITVICNGNNL